MKELLKKLKGNKRNIVLTIVTFLVAILYGFGFYETNKDKSTEEVINNAVEEVRDYIATYEMTDKEIEELATTEIEEQTEEQENAQEQTVEDEGFELQGEIAYEGDKARSWNVELGDYKGLTYYSQIDRRWKNKMYSSVNDRSQTVGTSGCGPTSAAMIVTACKGTITPDKMSDLFVQYGYRSSNQGTYWSAFRAVADEFNIGYTETTDIQRALQLLQSNHYVVASVGNGLFTTGGHFIVLVGIDGDTIKIYDPYLYAGKFETSTRRGKVTVSGHTVYCSVENFKRYANAKGFFCYKHDENVTVNNTQTVTTASYTRYVKASGGLNVRNAPNGTRIGGLASGIKVTVYEISGNWSRIGNGQWVSSNYLVSYSDKPTQTQNTVGITKKLSKASTLYEYSNLSGKRYNYKANTTITILQNINASVDRVRVNQTGRIAYINNSNYTNVVISKSKSTTRKTKQCTLYSKSNLSGVKYQYKANTTVTVLQHINSYIDKVKVNANGRIAYINVNSYK